MAFDHNHKFPRTARHGPLMHSRCEVCGVPYADAVYADAPCTHERVLTAEPLQHPIPINVQPSFPSQATQEILRNYSALYATTSGISQDPGGTGVMRRNGVSFVVPQGLLEPMPTVEEMHGHDIDPLTYTCRRCHSYLRHIRAMGLECTGVMRKNEPPKVESLPRKRRVVWDKEPKE